MRIALPELKDQFGGFVQDRVLILDADGPCYVASSTVKTLSTALKRFQQIILTQMFLTESKHAVLHLTASTSFKGGRFNILAHKPYQGNRSGKSKPSLLEPLRQAVALEQNWLPEYTVQLHHVLEADDGMIIDAHRLKEHGVIWSDDKDLRMTPYLYFDKKTNKVLPSAGFGSVWEHIGSQGQRECKGHGLKFFWAQMLMGDTADNIKGLLKLQGKDCGPGATLDWLTPLSTQDDTANFVFEQYRSIDQNPIPEGWLLWLRRTEIDTVLAYFAELNLTQQNAEFLRDCQFREWYKE